MSWEYVYGCWTKNMGFYPPNHPFVHRVLEPLFSPSILGGKHPYFWKHPYTEIPTGEVVLLWHFNLEDLRWEIILAGYREFHNHWQWWLMASSAKDIYKNILEFQATIVLCAWAISSKYVHHNISWTVIVSNLPMVTWELLKHACFAPKTNLWQHYCNFNDGRKWKNICK